MDTAPTDIHEFIGYRLPDEVYYYLSRGLIGAQVLNTLISGVLIEMPPTGNGESIEYHSFLNQLSEIRTQTLSLLSQPLHQFYQQRKVVSLYWFEPNIEHVMLHHASAVQQTGGHNVGAVSSALNNVWERTQGWCVGRELIEEELRKQKVSHLIFITLDGREGPGIPGVHHDHVISVRKILVIDRRHSILHASRCN